MAQTYDVDLGSQSAEVTADSYKADEHFVTFYRNLPGEMSDYPVASYPTRFVQSITAKAN